MRIYNSKFFSILSSIVLVLMLGAGFHTLAQKGGHGNHGGGNGNGRGNGGGQAGPPQGGPPPGRGWRKNEQPQPQPQQVPAWANRPAPQPQYQQRVYQPQVVIQQPRGEWRQSKQEWKQERKAAKIERSEWRQQPQVVVEQPRRQGPPPWAGVWTAPGQLKKAERLAERQRRVENYDYDVERQPEYRRYRQERQYVAPAEPNNYYSYGQPPVRYYEEPSYQYYQAPRYLGSTAYQYSPSGYYGGSIPVISYLPSYGGDDLFGPENYYYQPESFSLSDPFLGGVDWKGFLLSTVVNTLFGGRGGNEPFGYSNSPLGAIGGLFNGDEGDFGGYSPVGYADPAYGDPFAGSGGQEIYDAGYQRGLEIGRQAVISGEDFASLNDPYVLDQAGFGYGASALNLDQRRALNEGFADGYQDAVSNPNELAVNDGRGVDWTSAIIGGLLSLFNG